MSIVIVTLQLLCILVLANFNAAQAHHAIEPLSEVEVASEDVKNVVTDTNGGDTFITIEKKDGTKVYARAPAHEPIIINGVEYPKTTGKKSWALVAAALLLAVAFLLIVLVMRRKRK